MNTTPNITDLQHKRHFIIQSLITGNLSEKKLLRTCLDEFEINVHTPKRIILIEMNPPATFSNIPVFQSKVSQFLEILPLDLFDFSYPNKYYILIDNTLSETSPSVFREFACTHKELLKISVGKDCDISHLKLSYTSAFFALRSIADTNEPFALFDSMGLESLLLELSSQTQKNFSQAILGELSEEDILFLNIYFDEDRSLTGTSRQLYMHKNTVQYRLARIAQKSGYNPRHFHDAVLLYIALKLWNKLH